MAFLKVGIHENLVLSSDTKINDKGTLELAIKTVEDPNALLNAFENNTTFQSMGSSFRFYPPSLKNFEGDLKTAPEIAQEVLKMRHQLMQYALLFGTKEVAQDAIGGMKLFEGIGIVPEDYAKAIQQLNGEEFLGKVVTNLCTKFVAYLGAQNAYDGTVRFRQKFLRQSKAKNYAVISKSDFDVWIEPMDVTKEASKVAFSEYEVKGGYNNPDPVSSDGSDATVEDANKAKSLFAAPTDAASAGTDKAPNAAGDVAETASKPDLFAPKE
jgi:hypothetical protein